MPRPDVSEVRRAQILDAALVVFNARGFHAARMEDIVQQTGLSKGTLYWYFKSKEELVAALMRRLFMEDLAALHTSIATEGTVRARLRQHIGSLAALMLALRPSLPVIYEFYAASTRSPELGAVFAEYFAAYRQPLRVLLEQGVERTEFSPQHDLDAVVIALIGVIEGTLMLHVLSGDAFDLIVQLITGVDLLLTGLETGIA